MSFTERIQFVVDAITGGAEKNLKGLRTELAHAEGGTGKVRSAVGSLGGMLRDNLTTAVAGAGAALVAFGVKAVGEFQTLALEADKWATATGLSTQEASRWIEVAGDLGVTADTVQGALNRLNRVAASDDLAKYGITAQNANERLIQTLEYLQGITDETKRAADGQKLLGRSWTELAPLVQSAGNLRDLLAEVSDAKVIDEAEVEKAKRYRDAMDELKGNLEDLTLVAGEYLVPALANVAESITAIKEAIDVLPDLPPWVDKILKTSGIQAARDLVQGIRDLNNGVSADEVLDRFVNGPPPTGTVGPGMGTRNAPTTVTNINYYPASTDGRDVDRGLQEYYRRNGGEP